MGDRATEHGIEIHTALSVRPGSDGAAMDACEQARALFEGRDGADLVLVFASAHHVESMSAIGRIVGRELGPRCLVGVTGEGVVGPCAEVERSPGLSLLAARLPGAECVTFTSDDLHDLHAPDGHERIGEAIGAGPELRATLLFADPFSVPLVRLLPAMSASRATGPDGRPVGRLLGGMASAGKAAGGNALLLDGAVRRDGAVGVSLRGPLRFDTVVSQGCRPFGPPLVVTKARSNIVMELGGRPAMESVKEAVEGLGEHERKLLGNGLFLGRVVNEYKDRFGRGDFLIRQVTGADQASGAIAVADLMRVGQTVQLHLRDAATADEDLSLLLDGQKLYDRPAGAVLITCNARGRRFFGSSGHDAVAIERAFRPDEAGESRAKGGEAITPADATFPLAGFFAAGEIGPVGDASFLHGHTACVGLFRDVEPDG